MSDQDQIFPYNIKQYQERTMLFLFLLNEEGQESYLTHLGFETTEFQNTWKLFTVANSRYQLS